MSDRPKDLPQLDADRINEIRDLLTYQSSISFHSARAHESMWMLHDYAERGVITIPAADRQRIIDLLASTVFHCFDNEEFGLSAKHAAAVTDALLAAGVFREEPTVLPRTDMIEILNHYFGEYATDDYEQAADALTDLQKHPVEGRWTSEAPTTSPVSSGNFDARSTVFQS